MNQAVMERLQLERDIRRGLDEQEFCVYFQPQWSIDGRLITGWEALVRWNHPQRGLLMPSVFIPVAEETGMIRELGHYVLKTACLEAARWQREGIGSFTVSVNISAHQFEQKNMLQIIEDALNSSGLPAELLELEITESVMLKDPDKTLQLLNVLRMRGVHVAIDDFGTGYSSLSYLSTLPIDRLKIDRSFINSSLDKPSSSVIIEAVVSLARSLGMRTIAEGVETEAQRRFLRLQGCEEIQGYLMGRPMPAEAISTYLMSACR